MSTPARPADLWGEHHHDAAALLCVDGRHRYYLTRDLDGPGVPLHFCMFNPSPATTVNEMRHLVAMPGVRAAPRGAADADRPP